MPDTTLPTFDYKNPSVRYAGCSTGACHQNNTLASAATTNPAMALQQPADAFTRSAL